LLKRGFEEDKDLISPLKLEHPSYSLFDMRSFSFLLFYLFLIGFVNGESGLWGTTKFRQGKIENQVIIKAATTTSPATCIHMCQDTTNCTAIQHNVIYNSDNIYKY